MGRWEYEYRRKSLEEYIDIIKANAFFWLNWRQKRFLVYLACHPTEWLGNEEYRDLNGMGGRVSTASREIQKLVKDRLVRSNGAIRRGARYQLHPYMGMIHKFGAKEVRKVRMPLLEKLGTKRARTPAYQYKRTLFLDDSIWSDSKRRRINDQRKNIHSMLLDVCHPKKGPYKNFIFLR